MLWSLYQLGLNYIILLTLICYIITLIHEYTPLRSRWKQSKITTKTSDPITSFTSHRTSKLHPDLSILTHQNFHPNGVFLLLTTTKNFIKPTKVRCTFGLPDWRLQECTMYRWLPKQPVVKVQHLGWWKLSQGLINLFIFREFWPMRFQNAIHRNDTVLHGLHVYVCLNDICFFPAAKYPKWSWLFRASFGRHRPCIPSEIRFYLKVLHHNIYTYYIISRNIYAYTY